MPREVVVTGLGFILANCDRVADFWDQTSRGESQLQFEPDPIDPSRKIATGRVRSFDPARYLSEIPEQFYRRYHRELQIYLASLFLARDEAALDLEAHAPDRIGLFDGSSRSGFEFWYERISRERETPRAELYSRRELITTGGTVGLAASLLRIRGPAHVFNATCSSGAVAIGHAFQAVRSSDIDVAFATGHDFGLVYPVLAMYSDANLISVEQDDPARAVRPYVDYSTNAFGEGAVTLVLEAREVAEARGAPILATLAGYEYGNNGYHPTTVDVAGVRPAQIINKVLERAGVAKSDVGFVVGHGNAVHLSDVSEENYMRLAFGPASPSVPLISTKPIYGHTLGASSAINAASAILMLREQFVIPTINIDPSRVKRASNHQPNRGEPRACKAGLAMSYGMGGHNTALLFRRVD